MYLQFRSVRDHRSLHDTMPHPQCCWQVLRTRPSSFLGDPKVRGRTLAIRCSTLQCVDEQRLISVVSEDCCHHASPQEGDSRSIRPRELSNLTFLSKLLERAAYEQIVSYFDRYQLHPELQSAYRKHRSTETATIKVMPDVYEAADAGSVTLLGLLDLSASFDTVNHRILLDRLGHDYGIGYWSSSGSNPIWRDAVNSCGSTESLQGLYQSPPVCRRGPSCGRSSLSRTRLQSSPSFSTTASRCTRSPTTYSYTDRRLKAAPLTWWLGCRTVSSLSRHGWAQIDYGSTHPRPSWFGWEQVAVCSTAPVSQWASVELMFVRSSAFAISVSMTLLNHVNNVAGICCYQLRQLRIIRRSLTTEAAHSLVRALIHTRVDYCNGLLTAGPKYLHEKLQCVLRAAARLVLQLLHRASVSDIMRRQLHWLEMPDRIRFKLCTLVFRCLHGLAPRYLSDLCTPATVHTHLRSSVTLERSLLVPRTKTKTIGPRGFYFASSAAWNAFPVHLRDPGLSLNNFKIELKTHLGIMFSGFVARANAIIYKLARANIWIELNWISYRFRDIRF